MDNDCKITLFAKIEVVREGLRRILEEDGFAVVGSVSNLSELERFRDHDDERHIILCDISTCAEAISVARGLRTRFESSRIVFMAEEVGIESVSAAFGEGIDGYVIRSISCDPLKNVLRLVAAGEKAFPSQLVSALNANVWKLPPDKWDMEDLNLSDREMQILCCLVSGDANKVIARQLLITEATVKAHVKTVLRKLRVTNRTQAAIWAFTRGLGQDTVPDLGPRVERLPLPVASAPVQPLQLVAV
jgi:two-component system, NarL family, nitrate/nitrite response regulator NarL